MVLSTKVVTNTSSMMGSKQPWLYIDSDVCPRQGQTLRWSDFVLISIPVLQSLQDWFWTHRNKPASASQELGSNVCAIMSWKVY